MSTFGQISRGILNITNALNLARLTGREITEEETRLLLQEVEIRNKLASATDPTKISQWNDELAIVRDRLEAIKKEKADQHFNDIFTAISSVGIAASTTTSAIIQLLPQLRALGATAAAVSIGTSLTIPVIGQLIAVFTALFLATRYLSEPLLTPLIESLSMIDYWWYVNGLPTFEDMIEWFTVFLPNAFSIAGIAIQTSLFAGFLNGFNGIRDIVNAGGKLIVDGINSVVRAVVNAINTLIALYNAAARKLGRPTIEAVGFTPIEFKPLGNLDVKPSSFTGLQLGTGIPTGPVLTSSGSSGSNGIFNQINLTIQGSVWQKEQLFKEIDTYLKEELRRRGFTGY